MFQNSQKNGGKENIIFVSMQIIQFNITLFIYIKRKLKKLKKNLILVLSEGWVKKKVSIIF